VANTVVQRPDPEKLLEQVLAQEKYESRGRLKVFLGYAGGVGKSFRMLDEGRRRKQRGGEDVVVGAIQPKASPEVDALLQNMEVIPPLIIDGAAVMDVEAILRRRPQVCLVDGLAYDNPPGSRHAKRWEDVEELLSAGISVIATVNLQYIDEQRERVERITGKRAEHTVPQSFLSNADEIEVVDAPPEICRQRITAALSQKGPAAEAAILAEEQKLSELREIALLLAADVVDKQLEAYLERQGIQQLWGTQERFLVFVTPDVDARAMIASGRRNADRFHGELFVAYASQPDLTADEQAALESNLAQARAAQAHIEALDGEDEVDTLLRFARTRCITQIFVANRRRHSWRERIFGGPLDRLIQAAESMDVRVFPQ
jgi:two-component system, OmpR family, sensor histidine kinase KdpD